MNRAWRWVRPLAPLLLMAALVSGCAASRASAGEPVPCRDSMYLRLKVVPPDSLSAREFQRLHDLEQSCAQARMAHQSEMAGMGGMHGAAWWMLAMPAMMLVGGLMWVMMR